RAPLPEACGRARPSAPGAPRTEARPGRSAATPPPGPRARPGSPATPRPGSARRTCPDPRTGRPTCRPCRGPRRLPLDLHQLRLFVRDDLVDLRDVLVRQLLELPL